MNEREANPTPSYGTFLWVTAICIVGATGLIGTPEYAE